MDMRVGEIPNGLPKTYMGWIKYAVGIPISNPQPVYMGPYEDRMAISYLPILRIRNKPGVVGGREFDLIRE
jgi:hypothetical protein